MARTYTELEAWAIFIGALVIGVVLTSFFWAYITVPADAKKIGKLISNTSEKNLSDSITIPKDFVAFCENIDGISKWDNTGFRQCTLNEPSEKNLMEMKLLCKKYNLSLSYGSFGVRCEGKI